MTADGECAKFFQGLLEAEPAFKALSADPDWRYRPSPELGPRQVHPVNQMLR
jgi:hypothetical protein